jgi:LEA14-like dessication related protein
MHKLARLLSSALVALAACQSAPAPVPPSPPAAPAPPPKPAEPPLALAPLAVESQALSAVTLKLSGKLGEGVTGRELAWKARIGDREAGSGTAPLAGPGDFAVPVTATFGATVEELQAYQASDTAQVTIEATVANGAASVTETRGLEVRAPRLLQTKVVNVQASKPDKDVIDLVFRFEVHNPNAWEEPLGKLEYAIAIDGKPLEKDFVPGGGEKIPPGGKLELNLTAQATADKVGKEMPKLFKQTEYGWTISGTLKSRAFTLPVELKGTMKVSR